MNQNLQIGDKVKVLKRGENASGWQEIGRGHVLGMATGKSDWIKFLDSEVKDPACAEWVCAEAACSRVIKW